MLIIILAQVLMKMKNLSPPLWIDDSKSQEQRISPKEVMTRPEI
jgi:hypothetical protein